MPMPTDLLSEHTSGHSSPQSRLRLNTTSVSDHLSKVTAIRGQTSLTSRERLDVLRVFFVLYKDAPTEGRECNFYHRTATRLGRSTKTIPSIVKSWATLYVDDPTDIDGFRSAVRSKRHIGNTKRSETRIPSTLVYHVFVPDFV